MYFVYDQLLMYIRGPFTFKEAVSARNQMATNNSYVIILKEVVDYKGDPV